MGMNAIEKILASHSEQDVVRPGDVVMVDVDVTVQFDSARADVLKIANPDKVVLLHDHVVPAPTVQAANNANNTLIRLADLGLDYKIVLMEDVSLEADAVVSCNPDIQSIEEIGRAHV